MPLKPYRRGKVWWAKGRIEHLGRPVTGYVRTSTSASTEEGATEWIALETERTIRRHLLGEEREALTFSEAVILYEAKPAEAKYLMRIVPEIGHRRVENIAPREVRSLGRKLYPEASTDTWHRQVVTPIKAVINAAHELGRCPPIRVRGYSTQERIDQDKRRGRETRVERKPVTREWVEKFVAEADPYNASLAEFLFETGARIGQAVALRPTDLDLRNARVWLPAAKGHPAQWVAISMEMVVRLANLPAKRPHDRRTNRRLDPRVFGYADRGGPRKAWKRICRRAGIEALTPHCFRHGFYTELRVRQGLDPITAARAGRWSNPSLPDRIYAHSDADERAIRAAIRTGHVQSESQKVVKPMK